MLSSSYAVTKADLKLPVHCYVRTGLPLCACSLQNEKAKELGFQTPRASCNSPSDFGNICRREAVCARDVKEKKYLEKTMLRCQKQRSITQTKGRACMNKQQDLSRSYARQCCILHADYSLLLLKLYQETCKTLSHFQMLLKERIITHLLVVKHPGHAHPLFFSSR